MSYRKHLYNQAEFSLTAYTYFVTAEYGRTQLLCGRALFPNSFQCQCTACLRLPLITHFPLTSS